MADSSIANLSSASALDQSELLAVVQGGDTKKATIEAVLNSKTEALGFALSDEVTAITGGNGKVTVRMPFALTLTEVRASLNTEQSSGSVLTIDINKTGSSILSTKLTIDNGEKSSTTATTPAVISDSALTDDCELTFDIDQAGVGGKGLKVWLIGNRA